MYGERIREQRKKLNLTMKELGRRINVAESTVSGYESETRKPDIEIIKKLSDLFEVSSDYLLGLTDDPSLFIKPKDHNDEQFAGLAFSNGGAEKLTEEEEEYLKESLVLFRKLKEKRTK
ncbi:helix-turn-helix domain-containing protein [Brevibacillus laterosporus]|uniref:helix-turn-helix domain-containing protein n=1 Tax=Brevibacillus laterosporus TaxID=1465 RepID=UPI000CE4FB39|nr:helix-turn-helix transcriptional regulator [Brevibacillus laterosporus]PPA85910.1 XRE family transcriptional regulator [Brevibacillus laterosporus]